MKNVKLLPLLSVLFLASCHSSYTLVKKRYSDGYHISKKGEVAIVPKQEWKAKEKPGAVSTAAAEPAAAAQEELLASAGNAPVTEAAKKPRIAESASGDHFYQASVYRENKIPAKQRELISHDLRMNEKMLAPHATNIIEILLAIFLPPLAVFLHTEELGALFWVDLLLTIFFWLPGVIMAFIVILM